MNMQNIVSRIMANMSCPNGLSRYPNHAVTRHPSPAVIAYLRESDVLPFVDGAMLGRLVRVERTLRADESGGAAEPGHEIQCMTVDSTSQPDGEQCTIAVWPDADSEPK